MPEAMPPSTTHARRKVQRYLISGAASEAIEYASFFVLLDVTHLLILSNSVSFIFGIASGFVFHKFWSFAGEQRLQTRRQAVSYSLLAAGNFTITNILISLLVHDAHMPATVAKLCTMALTAAWSFVLFNMVIFRHRA